MPNQKKVLKSWTTLKQKLITTLTELKANHKDKWALVKSKSSPKQVKDLPVHELEKLKGELEEKQSLLKRMKQKMEQRKKHELVSPTDQLKHDQLTQEITSLQAEIAWQEEVKDNWEDVSKARLTFFRNRELKQDLTWTNERIYELNNKLNWLRTLVRSGDIQQLQTLVRQAKI